MRDFFRALRKQAKRIREQEYQMYRDVLKDEEDVRQIVDQQKASFEMAMKMKKMMRILMGNL